VKNRSSLLALKEWNHPSFTILLDAVHHMSATVSGVGDYVEVVSLALEFSKIVAGKLWYPLLDALSRLVWSSVYHLPTSFTA